MEEMTRTGTPLVCKGMIPFPKTGENRRATEFLYQFKSSGAIAFHRPHAKRDRESRPAYLPGRGFLDSGCYRFSGVLAKVLISLKNSPEKTISD
jgi:hypothetical protein